MRSGLINLSFVKNALSRWRFMLKSIWLIIKLRNNNKFMSLTPEQFDILVTKDDLKNLEERLDEKMDKKINKVLTAIDGIAHKHQSFETEMAANVGAHDRFENKFTATNGRVEVLEKKLGVSRAVA